MQYHTILCSQKVKYWKLPNVEISTAYKVTELLQLAIALFFTLAAQMWCLSRYLPLLVGDLVPEENEMWQNFILLLQIEEIVFAPKTTVQLAAYLDVLVGEYLEDFRRLYERPLLPKQHFMVHYPRQIVR